MKKVRVSDSPETSQYVGDDEMPKPEGGVWKLSPSEPRIVFILDVIVRKEYPLTKASKIIGNYSVPHRLQPPYGVNLRIESEMSRLDDLVDKLKSMLVELADAVELVCVEDYIVIYGREYVLRFMGLRGCNGKTLRNRVFMLCRVGQSVIYVVIYRGKVIVRILRGVKTENIDPLVIPRSLYRRCELSTPAIAGYINDRALLIRKMMNALSRDLSRG